MAAIEHHPHPKDAVKRSHHRLKHAHAAIHADALETAEEHYAAVKLQQAAQTALESLTTPPTS